MTSFCRRVPFYGCLILFFSMLLPVSWGDTSTTSSFTRIRPSSTNPADPNATPPPTSGTSSGQNKAGQTPATTGNKGLSVKQNRLPIQSRQSAKSRDSSKPREKILDHAATQSRP